MTRDEIYKDYENFTAKFDGGKFCPDNIKIYESLKNTQYYGKCPDFMVDGIWYEHEGFTTANPKNAFKNMLKHGLTQSDRIMLEDPKLTYIYMNRAIYKKLENGDNIKEV